MVLARCAFHVSSEDSRRRYDDADTTKCVGATPPRRPLHRNPSRRSRAEGHLVARLPKSERPQLPACRARALRPLALRLPTVRILALRLRTVRDLTLCAVALWIAIGAVGCQSAPNPKNAPTTSAPVEDLETASSPSIEDPLSSRPIEQHYDDAELQRIRFQKGFVKQSFLALLQACKLFKLKHGRYPATLDELVTPPNGEAPYIRGSLVDPWSGEPYRYSLEQGEPRIVSYGPDLSLGGEGPNADIDTSSRDFDR